MGAEHLPQRFASTLHFNSAVAQVFDRRPVSANGDRQ
jgi:hypothetical protein